MAASKALAESDLSHFFKIINEILHSAWDEYQSYPIALRVHHSPRSRATLVHDFIRRIVQERFEGRSEVHLVNSRGLLLVNFFQKYLLRFKKLSRSGKPQNVPTNQTNLFNGQQMELPCMPEMPTCLVAGYQLDPLQKEIQTCRILCPDGHLIRWDISLEENLEATLQPITIIDPTKPQKGRKVKPKNILPKSKNDE